jgi:hypothetical protein
MDVMWSWRRGGSKFLVTLGCAQGELYDNGQSGLKIKTAAGLMATEANDQSRGLNQMMRPMSLQKGPE